MPQESKLIVLNKNAKNFLDTVGVDTSACEKFLEVEQSNCNVSKTCFHKTGREFIKQKFTASASNAKNVLNLSQHLIPFSVTITTSTLNGEPLVPYLDVSIKGSLSVSTCFLHMFLSHFPIHFLSLSHQFLSSSVSCLKWIFCYIHKIILIYGYNH